MPARDAATGLCLAWCGRHCERLSRARGVPLSAGQSNLSSRDMAALGILLAAFANLGIKPKTVISSEGELHYIATAAALLRDDYTFPTSEFERLIDGFAHVGTYKFRLYEVKSVPAELPNFHQWFVSIYL